MRTALALLTLLALGAPPVQAAPPAAARVFSITGADCGSCGTAVSQAVRKLKGVKRATFDRDRVEIAVVAAPGVSDDAIIRAIEGTGGSLRAVAGPGRGAYLPFPDWPEGADARVLTREGEAVGPLEALRVPGKWTVFDVYADWCGPCRTVDEHLRDLASVRKDIAVRKLNVKRFDTPLARELGPRLRALPYVIVFAPGGRRTDLVGADLDKLDAALASR